MKDVLTEYDTKVYERLREHRQAAIEHYPNHDWFVICVQGSQNYGMADENSDVDSKMLLIPTLEELVLNKPAISHTLILENEEHVDCKDIRDYFKIIRKQNINFMEIFFTDYFIVNPKYSDLWYDILANREDIAQSNIYRFLKCIKGMAHEKQHALCHEYPSKMDIIMKYGYDGKQLSHAIRILDFAKRYVLGNESYKDCLTPRNVKCLKNLKRNNAGISKTEAIEWMEDTVNEVDFFEAQQNKYRKDVIDPEVDEFLNNVLYKIIVRSLKERLEYVQYQMESKR